MPSKKQVVFDLIVVFSLTSLLVVAAFMNLLPSTTENPQEPQLAPDVDLKDQNLAVPDWGFELSNGTTITLDAYSGYFVIVDLMSTSCPACESENIELAGIYSKYNTSIKILSLSVDLSSTSEGLANYKSSRGIPWDVGIDNGHFVNYFNIRYTPTLVIIDPDGYFRMYHEGLWLASSILSTISSIS